MTKPFTILSISDIHLGHKKTTTEFIIKNLDEYLSNNKVLCSVDLLIIAGDVFESLLHLSAKEVSQIDYWIARLLKLCSKHNVCVRVLEGTPSHDRGQSERFVTINNILNEGIKVDLKYFNSLSIEHIDRFGIDVLYVPDEWSSTNEKTLEEVKELLASKGLKKVDYAIMHGTFEHQLPSHLVSLQKHDNKEYLSLVRELIFVGHIHQHSISDRIISQGSFDRLAHGEQEAKGLVRVTVEKDNHKHIEFIKNKGAKKYITIDCFESDIEDSLVKIMNKIKKLEPDSFVRIRCDKGSNIGSSLGVLKTKWPTLNWSISAIVDEEDSVLLVENAPTYIPLIINRGNISNLIKDRLSKLSLDEQTLNRCQQVLQESL